MELRLDNNSRIRFDWTQQGALYVQLLQPATLKDGHGLLLTGTALLSGDELTVFLAEMGRTQDTQEVRL